MRVTFLPDWDWALWQSRAQSYSCIGHLYSIKIDVPCWMIHVTSYTSASQPIFTTNCSLFSYTISQHNILGKLIFRTLWRHIEPFCCTDCCFPYSSLFPLYCPSSRPCQPDEVTFMLAKWIWKHLVQHSLPRFQSFWHPRCHCVALHQIHCLPPSYLHCHFSYLSHHSCQPKFRCWWCFQVHHPYDCLLDDSQFSWFGWQWILVFILQEGPVWTKLVVKFIISTTIMQQHYHGYSGTRMLWWSFQDLKWILWLSSVSFEHEIPSM